jgi:hypothetical protein
MKQVNLLKIITLISICALLIGAVVFSASATMEQQTLEISKKNILFGDRMHLMFALKATENVQVNATCGDVDVAIEYMGIETIEGEDYRVYRTVDGWAPQNINAVVTVTAVDGDQMDKLSYSVLMYLYERLNLDDLDPEKEADRIHMYETLLEYATVADKIINSQDGRTPNELDRYHYVSVVDGTLDGYNSWGMFKDGDKPFADLDHSLLLEEGEGDVIEIGASRIKGETPNDWMRDVSEIAKNLKAVTAMSEIKSIVTNLEAAVVKARSFAENADTIVAGLERGEGTVGKLLSKDDKVYRYLETTLSAAAEISGRLERGEGTIGKLLTKEGDFHGDLKEAIAAFKKSSESFDVTKLKSDARTLVLNADKLMVDAGVLVSNLTVVAERLREGEGTLGRLSKDASRYDEANGLVRDIRQVVDNYRDTTPITTFASLIGGAL